MRIFSLEFKLYIYTHACVNPSLFVVLEVEVLKLCHVSFHVCYDCVQRQSFFFVWCVIRFCRFLASRTVYPI